MNHINQLEWRYATKRMTGEKIDEASLHTILKAIQLAPTSLGLQPFTILQIESDEAKEKLAKACQQPQVKESSCVLAFCAWTSFSEEKVDAYMENIATTRSLETHQLADFKKMILNFVGGLNNENFKNWASHQAYIALGFGMYAAALEQIDATPMEGFAPAVFDEVFNLNEKGLSSVVLLALGKRDENTDYLAKAKKVRRSHEQLYISL